jgi:ABC-type multidrug transport system fused ATPase/permease subunit
LARLYPQAGTILVDGVDISLASRSALRAGIATVAQKPFFHGGSVRSNLSLWCARSYGAPVQHTLGSLDAEVADSVFWRALTVVGLAEKVGAAGAGLDALLDGEEGGGAQGGGGGGCGGGGGSSDGSGSGQRLSLSQGERQLLSVARLMVPFCRAEAAAAPRGAGRSPPRFAVRSDDARHGRLPCLVLADEPTSSLDAEGDQRVLRLLTSLPATLLCVCHRLENVRQFDHVIVLGDGLVIEQGSPADLLDGGNGGGGGGGGGGGELARLMAQHHQHQQQQQQQQQQQH